MQIEQSSQSMNTEINKKKTFFKRADLVFIDRTFYVQLLDLFNKWVIIYVHSMLC